MSNPPLCYNMDTGIGCKHPKAYAIPYIGFEDEIAFRCDACHNFWLYKDNAFSNPRYIAPGSVVCDINFTWPTWPSYEALPRGGYF